MQMNYYLIYLTDFTAWDGVVMTESERVGGEEGGAARSR